MFALLQAELHVHDDMFERFLSVASCASVFEICDTAQVLVTFFGVFAAL